MNAVAEALTGWTIDESKGRPLREVFHIVNEDNRQPVESPADKVKRLGTIVGLANHTILIRKDGVETPIDDSGAPIRDDAGEISGIILVFRSVAERRAIRKVATTKRRAPTPGPCRRQRRRYLGLGRHQRSRLRRRRASLASTVSAPRRQPPESPSPSSLATSTRMTSIESRRPITNALQSDEEFSCEYRLLQGRCFHPMGRSRRPRHLRTRWHTHPLPGSHPRHHRAQIYRGSPSRGARHASAQSTAPASSTSASSLPQESSSTATAPPSNSRATPSRDVIGKNFWDTPWFSYTPGAPEMVKQAVTRAASGEFLRQEVSLIRPSGDAITFDFSLAPVRDESGKVVFLIPEGRDVTDLKRAESALMQSEKLAAVGRLASSIAHEINNPLESVMNLIYLAQQHAIAPDAQKFLGFSRSGDPPCLTHRESDPAFSQTASNPQAVSSSDLFLTVLSIYEGRFRNSKIGIETRERATQPIICFEGDIRQVLHNLVANAIDAIALGWTAPAPKPRSNTLAHKPQRDSPSPSPTRASP